MLSSSRGVHNSIRSRENSSPGSIIWPLCVVTIPTFLHNKPVLLVQLTPPGDLEGFHGYLSPVRAGASRQNMCEPNHQSRQRTYQLANNKAVVSADSNAHNGHNCRGEEYPRIYFNPHPKSRQPRHGSGASEQTHKTWCILHHFLPSPLRNMSRTSQTLHNINTTKTALGEHNAEGTPCLLVRGILTSTRENLRRTR